MEDQQVANADVVAGNGDGVGANGTIDEADILTYTFAHAGGATIFLADDDLLVVVAVVMTTVEGMHHAVGGFLNTVAEGVVTAVVVVVTHVGAAWRINGSLGFDFDIFLMRLGAATLVFNVVGWLDATTVITLCNIDFLFVTRDFDVDFCFCAALITWFAVAVVGRNVSGRWLELN